jgi:signal transduction histidine kinase
MRNLAPWQTPARRGAFWPFHRPLDIERARPVVILLCMISAAEVTLLLESAAPQIGRPLDALVAALVAGLVVDLAITKRRLERRLEASRARRVETLDLERQRIERDLHDSVQQRLVSVRIRMGTLAERHRGARSSLLLMARDVDRSLTEIRSITLHGSPDLLRRIGVPAALRSATASATLPVVVEAPGFGRFAPHFEQNLYYCCLEAIQNVVKHAGGRRAWIRLRQEPGRVTFEIEDSGCGFDPSRVTPGDGLRNMTDRVESLGGSLSIDTTPALGTRIRGEIPIGDAR